MSLPILPSTHTLFYHVSLAVIATSLSPLTATAANFLRDSGFEIGYAEAGEAFTDTVGTPLSNNSAWTRSVGTCDAWAGGPRDSTGYGRWGGLANGVPAVPNEGGNFAACGGWYPPGERITQRVTGATPGQEYKLSFWYTHAGVEGLTPIGFKASAGLWVNRRFIGSTQPLPYLGAGRQQWEKASFVYTPTSTSFDFTIGYHGQQGRPDYGYIAFDGASVVAAVPTTDITVITEIINDDNGSNTLNDFAVTTDAGVLTFDSGVLSGSVKTYTSNTLPVTADTTYQLSATDDSGYTPGNWSCTGNNSPAVVQTFVEGFIRANVTIADGDSVTCTLTYDDIPAPVCTALSGNVNTGLAPVSKLKNGDKLFLSSTDLNTAEGHLKAFTISASGLPTDAAVWDAYTTMNTQNQRATRLFSTAAGTKTLFKDLVDPAFGADGVPSNATLISSVSSARLGAISPHSNLALLDNSVNVARYLADDDYKTFYNETISLRSSANNASVPKLVVLSSDDGFLYAFKQENGNLLWGWTPPSIVKRMRNATGFTAEHNMQGVVDIMDLKQSTSYSSYVVGSYRKGLGQYVLKLNTDSSLNSIVWDTDHKEDNALAGSAPNQGKRAYFSDANGKRFMAYVITSTTNDSVLHIRSIADASLHHQIMLNFTATTTPFVMPRFKNGPTANTLYLGDSHGNIYAAPLLVATGANAGNLNTAQTLTSAFTTAVTALNTSDSSPVTFIGATTSKTGRKIYLRAQSNDRFTLFDYKRADASWKRLWTTYTGGAGKWVGNATTLTSDPLIASLPVGASLSADAYVIAGSIVLPVTLAPDLSSCEGQAYYYLYQLKDGHIPTKTFYQTSDSSAITGPISLGKGEARRLHVAEYPASDKLIGLGMADQKTDGSTGINSSFFIVDPIATGVRGWKTLK